MQMFPDMKRLTFKIWSILNLLSRSDENRPGIGRDFVLGGRPDWFPGVDFEWLVFGRYLSGI